jgi:hypothetical protein
MKYLKIENNTGLYTLNGSDWLAIDKINKQALLELLNIALTADFEMDEYKKENLGNPAHQIIYSNIYAKFKDILDNKNIFKDEAESLYKEAIQKYSK